MNDTEVVKSTVKRAVSLASEINYIELGKNIVKTAIPLAKVLLVVKDIKDVREGEFDPSIRKSIEIYKKILVADSGVLSPVSKIVRAVFLEEDINTAEYLGWLKSVSTESLLFLLKVYFSTGDVTNLDLYKDLSNSFPGNVPGTFSNNSAYSKLINSILGFFSVAICASPKEIAKLQMATVAGQENSIDSVLDEQALLGYSFDDAEELILASLREQFQVRFKESLLAVAADQLEIIDKQWFENIIRDGLELDNYGDDYSSYLKRVEFDDFRKSLARILERSKKVRRNGFDYRDHRSSVQDKLGFSLLLKYASQCDDLEVSSENVFSVNNSIVIKCFFNRKSEVDLIVSTVTKSQPSEEDCDKLILPVAERGFSKAENKTEIERELSCALIGDSLDQARVSYRKGLLRVLGDESVEVQDRAIASLLDEESEFRAYYVVVQENTFGSELIKDFSRKYPLLRFVLRKDDETALKLNNFDEFWLKRGHLTKKV